MVFYEMDFSGMIIDNFHRLTARDISLSTISMSSRFHEPYPEVNSCFVKISTPQ